MSFGGKGDGVHKDTKAIQRALDVSAERKCKVVLSSGKVFLTGPLKLSSGVRMEIQRGAILRASDDEEDYPVIESRCAGVACRSYAPILSGENLERLVLEGEGIIDGNGVSWWRKFLLARLEVERPKLLSLHFGKELRLGGGLTLVNSPYWTIHLFHCSQVEITNLHIRNPELAPNTDGIDPESSQNIFISHVTLQTGDDCVSVKTEKRVVGDSTSSFSGRESRNITISDSLMLSGHGAVAIGSETSGNIRDVLVRRCSFLKTDAGLRMKTMQGRGGIVERIRLEEVSMFKVAQPVDVEMEYHGMYEVPGDAKDSASPVIRSVSLVDTLLLESDLPVVNYGSNVNVNCLEHSPCTDFNVEKSFIFPFRLGRTSLNYLSGSLDGNPFSLLGKNSDNVNASVNYRNSTGDLEQRRTFFSILRRMVVVQGEEPEGELGDDDETPEMKEKDRRTTGGQLRQIYKELERLGKLEEATRREGNESWLSLPFDKYWKKPYRIYPGSCGDGVVNCTDKQKDMWKKYQGNKARYEANWLKFAVPPSGETGSDFFILASSSSSHLSKLKERHSVSLSLTTSAAASSSPFSASFVSFVVVLLLLLLLCLYGFRRRLFPSSSPFLLLETLKLELRVESEDKDRRV